MTDLKRVKFDLQINRAGDLIVNGRNYGIVQSRLDAVLHSFLHDSTAEEFYSFVTMLGYYFGGQMAYQDSTQRTEGETPLVEMFRQSYDKGTQCFNLQKEEQQDG